MPSRNRQAWLAHAVWLGSMLLGLWYFSQQGNVVSDISQFMPRTSSQPQLNLILNEMQQGAAARYVLLRVTARDADTSTRISRGLKQHLAHSTHFAEVKNGSDDLSLDEVQSLYAYRFLLRAPADFSAPALRAALEQRLSELRSGMGVLLKQTLTSDPQNLFLQYLGGLAAQAQPMTHQGVWFDQAQRGAMLLLVLRSAGYDLDRQEQALGEITAYVNALPQANSVRLEMSGPAVMAVATRDSIRGTMQYLSAIAGGLLLLLFIWGYRSLSGFVISGLPLASAILAALVITNLIFGQVHGIVVAFGITLLGVCLDMPLHLFSHLQRHETARQTLTAIWPTLRLSVLTTAFSYVALLGTDFSGLSQLAVFAMAGLAAALLVTRWIVPTWLVGYRGRVAVTPVQVHCTTTCKRVLVALCITLPATVLVIQAEHLWSEDIASLSPIPQDARQLDQTLRQQMAVPEVGHVFVAEAPDPQALLEQVEALTATLHEAQAQGLVAHVYAVSDILPSHRMQAARRATLPDTQSLQQALNEALLGLPFAPPAFADFIAGVAQSRVLPPLDWLAIQQTPLADRLNQDMFERDGRWLSMIRLGGVADEAAWHQWLQTQPELAPHYLNLRVASSQLMNEYQQTAFSRLLLGVALIAAVMLLMTRSASQTLRLVAPILLAVLVTLSVQVALGTPLTLFHILALLLVVGMGLDYSLFFNRPLPPGNEAADDLKRRAHGVMMSAGSTLAAFGVMSFSNIPVLAALGQTVSMGVLCCYILAQLLADPWRQENNTAT